METEREIPLEGRAPRLRRLGLAAAAVYGPQLLPYAGGPLRECDHCVALYSKLFPLLPGASAAAGVQLATRRADLGAGIAAALLALVVLALAYRLTGLKPPLRGIALGVLAALLASQALLVASVLRS